MCEIEDRLDMAGWHVPEKYPAIAELCNNSIICILAAQVGYQDILSSVLRLGLHIISASVYCGTQFLEL